MLYAVVTFESPLFFLLDPFSFYACIHIHVQSKMAHREKQFLEGDSNLHPVPVAPTFLVNPIQPSSGTDLVQDNRDLNNWKPPRRKGTPVSKKQVGGSQ